MLGLGCLIQVRMMVMDTNRSDLSLWCHRKYINRVYSLLSNAIYEVKWELAKNKRYIACISYEYMRDLWGMTNGSSLNNSPGIHSVAALWCHCAKINKFDAMSKFCVAFFKVKTFGKHLLLNFLNECAEVRTQLTRMRSYIHIYVCVYVCMMQVCISSAAVHDARESIDRMSDWIARTNDDFAVVLPSFDRSRSIYK